MRQRRRSLLDLCHNYLLHKCEYLPDDFKRMAEGMIVFLNFLKFAEEELSTSKNGEVHKAGEE
jgi:hypothetical protein